ncbi:hypothetical protein [Sphingobacterium kitahiroshimense]|uniref:hypothetical protein n=1 Tax=Sphingobacterium kitahiroshimense TaxID=470446 RepID=UPI00320AC197
MAKNESNDALKLELDPATAKVIADLEDKVKSLKSELDKNDQLHSDEVGELNVKIKELEEVNATLTASNDEFFTSKDYLEAELELITSERDQAQVEMLQMSKALSSAQVAVKNGYQTVDHEGKTYAIHGKVFQYKGREYTSDDLLSDEELVGELLKIKVGFLVEVAKED